MFEKISFKKNPIFWWASGLFILGIILFLVMRNQIFLFGFIAAAYLLRPTLASLGIAKKYVDERQMSLNYRSSNIAFVVMMMTCVLLAGYLISKEDHAFEMFMMVIVIGLATKALFNVLLSKNFRLVAPKIIIAVGLFAALFSALGDIERGIFTLDFLMNILPGVIVASLGVLAIFLPRVIAVVIFAVMIFAEFIILRRGIDWATIGTASLIGIPLLLASFALWKKPKEIPI